MNQIKVFSDALALLRLQFYPGFASYRYPLPIMLALFLLLSIVNAAGVAPFLLTPAAQTVVIMMAITWLRFALLSLLIDKFYIRRLTQERLLVIVDQPPLLPHLYPSSRGFVLLSEALSTPLILTATAPIFTIIAPLWLIWVIWVQFYGIMKISRMPAARVVLIYALYFLLSLLLMPVILQIFVNIGWLDPVAISQNLETLFHIDAPLP